MNVEHSFTDNAKTSSKHLDFQKKYPFSLPKVKSNPTFLNPAPKIAIMNHVLSKVLCSLLFVCPLQLTIQAQDVKVPIDSISSPDKLKFKPKAFIIPSVLIGFGLAGMDNSFIKSINGEIKEELNESVDEYATIDNFSQYAPLCRPMRSMHSG